MRGIKSEIDWPPKLPKNFPMSVGKRGYYKSFSGKTKYVCGKLPPRAAEQRLRDRWDELTGNHRTAVRAGANARGADLTVKEMCNEYMAWLRQRVQSGRPRPMSKRTYEDYRLALQLFCNTMVKGFDGRLADRDAVALGPPDFTAFAARIPGTSPYTHSRYVAAVTACYSWANKADRIPHPVKFGPDFAKASVDELSAARADIEKSFTRDQVRVVLGADDKGRIVRELPPVWWAIVWICLNCAFANQDIGKLPRDAKILDLDGGVIQFRRGKKGRAYRKSLLWPVTVAAIRAYLPHRPKPAAEEHDGLLFLTNHGLPFVRHKDHVDDVGTLLKATRIDSAGQWFGDYLSSIEGLDSEGRSLSGFRTTFRTEAEAMPEDRKDNDAIDLIMGHRRRHISAQYVEKFPLSKLHNVLSFVWAQLFDGWASELADRPAATSPATEAAEPVAA